MNHRVNVASAQQVLYDYIAVCHELIRHQSSTPANACSSSTTCASCWRSTPPRRWDEERIAALAPSQDRDWIERQHRLARELRGFLQAGGRFDFHGLLDPTQLIRKSRIQGAALELTEMRDVLVLADRAAEWRETALHPPAAVEAQWEAVAELSQQLADFNPAAALLPQQDPARRHARRPRFAGAGAHPPRHRNGSAAPFRNRCGRTCASSPKAARYRTSSSPSAATASSFR